MRRRLAFAGLILIAFLVCITIAACSQHSQAAECEIFVSPAGNDSSGDGSKRAPFASVEKAVQKAGPGETVILRGGEYPAISLGEEASDLTIKAAEGENPVVVPDQKGDENIGIHIVDARDLCIEGIEVRGGTHGIFYESTKDSQADAFCDITIRDCRVHEVRGVHGIAVYARNDYTPVEDLTIEGCEVYDCQCGSSESLVINGNIDGFVIKKNTVHDNDNIGIDMIGFEGLAVHPANSIYAEPLDADFVRNGRCFRNVVYNISAEGNEAYLEDGKYDLCAGGIYVDGGQDIEIYGNFVFACDIGIEVATERKEADSDLFCVRGIDVHDNVVAECGGSGGISFGGYDSSRGSTEECRFHDNTLVDNELQFAVQKSRYNKVYDNLIVGGKAAFSFEPGGPESTVTNDIRANAAADLGDDGSWKASYGKYHESRQQVLDGLRPRIKGCGSSFVPEGEALEVYRDN